jgi:hypothetical protein
MIAGDLEERARHNWPHPEPFALDGSRCAVCGYDYAGDDPADLEELEDDR